MDKAQQTQVHMLLEKCQGKLINNNFDASIFTSKEEVLEFLKKQIPAGSTVGTGGSMTLETVGVIDWLRASSSITYYDRVGASDVEKILLAGQHADYYLMSSNAITLDGQLYNVDGRGNRLSALIYGPKKVFIVAGYNKIVKDIDDAITRVETIAAPQNCLRLNKGTPCTKLGTCAHCNMKDTICNSYVVTRRNAIPNRIHVLLVEEELGY